MKIRIIKEQRGYNRHYDVHGSEQEIKKDIMSINRGEDIDKSLDSIVYELNNMCKYAELGIQEIWVYVEQNLSPQHIDYIKSRLIGCDLPVDIGKKKRTFKKKFGDIF